MTDEVLNSADESAAEKPAPQTVEAEPVDLSKHLTGQVSSSVSPPEVNQGPAPESDVTASDVTPPWQKTADEIDQAERSALDAPLAGRRLANFGALAALVSRLGPLAGELQQLLAGVDTGKLKSLLDAIASLFAVSAPTGSADWLKQVGPAALKVLRIWSSIRPGDPDHELVDKLDKLLQAGGPALDAFNSLVGELLNHRPNYSVVMAQHVADVAHGGHTEAFAAAAINWTTIVSIAQAVFQLLQLLKGLKTPAAPAAG